MRRAVIVVPVSGAIWFCQFATTIAEGQVQGQDKPVGAAEDSGRYSFHRMGEGFLRLDTQTGHVAQCGWGATGWSCKVVPDERLALESEIARLQRENVALKKALLSHGLPLPNGVKPELAAPKQELPAAKDEPPSTTSPEKSPSSRWPSEADLDRAIAFVKDVWRRLVEMMVDLQRDIQRKS